MVMVTLSGSLKAAAAGHYELEIEAGTIRQLLDELGQRVPSLADHIERGVAVSIDGQIFRDDWFQKIPTGAEVFVRPRLAGG